MFVIVPLRVRIPGVTGSIFLVLIGLPVLALLACAFPLLGWLALTFAAVPLLGRLIDRSERQPE
jgi:hypothetical protein